MFLRGPATPALLAAAAVAAGAAALCAFPSGAFTITHPPLTPDRASRRSTLSSRTAAFETAGDVTDSPPEALPPPVAESVLSLELDKPLGVILEEVEEGAPMGVRVGELSESGSAYASEYADRLVGLKVAGVMGEDVTSMAFDDVMERIIDASSPVKIDFELPEEEEEEEPEPPVVFEVGTPVTITVIQDGVETPISARVGDNLRKTLLENGVELYRGLKKKLGNCGGVGQCTYCAVDFVEGEGWSERSEYEEGKIGKYPTARLACMNNIQGPATIRVQ